MKHDNPYVPGHKQADLFEEGETTQKKYVPLSELSDDDIRALPLEAFLPHEWAKLKELTKRHILKGRDLREFFPDADAVREYDYTSLMLDPRLADLGDQQLTDLALHTMENGLEKSYIGKSESNRDYALALYEREIIDLAQFLGPGPFSRARKDVTNALDEAVSEVVDYVPDPDYARELFDQEYYDEEGMITRFRQAQSAAHNELFEELKAQGLTDEEIEEHLGAALLDSEIYSDWQDCGYYRGDFTVRVHYSRPTIDLEPVYKEAESFPKEIRDDVLVYILKEEAISDVRDHVEEKHLINRQQQIYDEWGGEDQVICADADVDLLTAKVLELGDVEIGGNVDVIADPALSVEERTVYRPTHPDFKGFYLVDLTEKDLEEESENMNHCVDDETYGVPQSVRRGRAKVYSLRKPSGKPLFTIRAWLNANGEPSSIDQIRGYGNRFPGLDANEEPKKKLGEVDLAKEVIEQYFGMDPWDVKDMRAGLHAFAKRQEELAKLRKEQQARSAERRRRRERDNPTFEAYTGYERFRRLRGRPPKRKPARSEM